jgi:hypothetical protein
MGRIAAATSYVSGRRAPPPHATGCAHYVSGITDEPGPENLALYWHLNADRKINERADRRVDVQVNGARLQRHD